MGGVVNSLGRSVTSLFGGGAGAAEKVATDAVEKVATQDSGVDPSLSALQQQQLKNAKDFRANSGNMKSRLTQDLTAQNNNKMNADLHTTDENSNARGLLYGGMNAGKRAGVRANAQSNLAAGIGTINNGVDDAAGTLDQQAISTGQAIQKSQQDIQNQIYSRALAQQNADNSVVGSAASAGLLLALL